MKSILIVALTFLGATSFAKTYQLECKRTSTHEYYVKLSNTKASVCVDRSGETFSFSGCFRKENGINNNIEIEGEFSKQLSKGDNLVYVAEGLFSGIDSVEVSKDFMAALENGETNLSGFSLNYTVSGENIWLGQCELIN